MKKAAQATPNEKLLNERLQRRWSQSEVANMIGTTRINVSRWECGITTPGLYFRQQLCQLFEKSAEQLGINPKTANESSQRAVVTVPPLEVLETLPSTIEQEEIRVQPSGSLQPRLSILQLMSPLQRRLYRKPLSNKMHIAISVSMLSLCISLFTILFLFLGTGMLPGIAYRATALHKEAGSEAQYIQKKNIGLSDGHYIFDIYPGCTDIALKEQAALQLQHGDTSGAINSMTQAVSTDANDGETQIYNENLHVLQSRNAYVTIALGLAIDNSATDLIRARSIMKAAYLAQHEVNTRGLLPDNLRLRILIDNSGADNADVATVARFIADRVNNGNPDHIIGVIGWPFSLQTIDALDVIAGAHLPMISQTASSVSLNGDSPYFFRLNPTDDQQAQILSSEAIKQLHAKTILLVRDPADPYSVSLANAFSDRVAQSNVKLINDAPTSLFTEKRTTVEEYQQNIVRDALAKKVDLIFMAGFDDDAIRLAHALGNASRAAPQDMLLANLKVLSGDAVATSLVLGRGDGQDATIAKNFPQDMQRLVFSAFAYPDEWNFEKVPIDQQPPFFADWSRTYCSTASCENSTFSLDQCAMLTYDALQIFVRASTLVHGPLSGDTMRRALLSLGKGNIPTFRGVSGLVEFDNQGNPISKIVVILRVEETNGSNKFVLKMVSGMLN
jgi:ABC-type branched-subunit amino acid transport system substrate-binding protein/transcriptional regulator with XRE-family HTH domain